MSPRFQALKVAGERTRQPRQGQGGESSSEKFGKYVFTRGVMERMLPQKIVKNINRAIEGKEKIRPEYADPIALAMKEWATSLGATHYCHWFQPLTGATAEKHDSFIDWHEREGVIERFCGTQLIQGEPDASSFPSGGLRSTYEARGYTGWDPSSPVFVWKAGDGMTLFIPSVFFSWTGDVLDTKIPVLRSDNKINTAVLRLLNFVGIKANQVYSTLGWEQEYFVIDRALRNLRPDLVLAGRTVFGAASPKGQELQDHYFGAVKDRILAFMHDFEDEALKLGIPVKTRHNEVAPAQHEVAPVFEKASVAIDHNIMLMELMRQIAVKHDLTCLLHEKPFHGINGSGKHNNWSLATDTGLNLLDPGDSPESSLQFLILLTAVLDGVHRHADLLRASVASAGNDHRLGGHEAPPAIISVYLGEQLEALLHDIEQKGVHRGKGGKGKYDLGIPVIPELPKDNTDRNRTSPFAFTGNKFEFRAVGSSMSCALPITVLNVAVAESLNAMLDEITANLSQMPASRSRETLAEAATPVIRKTLKKSRNIRFSGDNYSAAWAKEAKTRGLSNIKKSVDAFEALKHPNTVKAFDGVLNKHELESRYEIWLEIYACTISIETKLMVEMFRTQIFPAAAKFQQALAESLTAIKEAGGTPGAAQKKRLTELVATCNKACKAVDDLQQTLSAVEKLQGVKLAQDLCRKVLPVAEKARAAVDALEDLVDDQCWPLPKYRELLFMV